MVEFLALSSSPDVISLQKGAPGDFILEKSLKLLQGAAKTSLVSRMSLEHCDLHSVYRMSQVQ